MTRPRILIITRNLPPLVGGMERLNWHMADELAKSADVKVIGPTDSALEKPESVTVWEAPLKPLPVFLTIAFLKGLWLGLRWQPDIILAGSGLTAPLAWLISKICRTRSAAYLHGFDITVDHLIYQKVWRPVFKKMDRIIVNSSPTKELAINAGVPENNLAIVHPGVTLPTQNQTDEDISLFKRQNGLSDKKIILSVGRLTTRKGIREFVSQSLPEIVEAIPNAVLVIVGESPKNSLGAGIQTRESIQAAADRRGLCNNIKFLGVITDKKQLATAYEAADVHIFPVRHIPGDPEGFGMVAIEAAAHGLPTVAFSTGGVVDAIEEGKSGFLAENHDYAHLSGLAIKTVSSSLSKEETKKFAEQFDWSIFGKSLASSLNDRKLAR